MGPPRTGTTWLYRVLRGHVGLPEGIKETHFFRQRYPLGAEWYARHFERCPPNLPIGEVAPSYFAPEEIRERVKLHIPDCRIICTLRDPAERMYSHYKLLNRGAMIKGDFAELAFTHPDLVTFSRYAYHLRGWQALFGRENVLVLIHEDCYLDRRAYVDKLCAFIGIPAIDVAALPWANDHINPNRTAPRNRKLVRRMGRWRARMIDHRHYRAVKLLQPIFNYWMRGGHAYGPLDASLKRKIKGQLRPEVDALEEIIGRDLSDWK